MLIVSALLLTTATHAPTAYADSTQCDPLSEQSSVARQVEYRFGGLAEGVLTVRVPVADVRDLVPPSYQLTGEDTGTATLVAAFGSVEQLTVGCSEARPAMVSEYGVFVDSPDGTPGRHAYYLWQLSDDRTLVSRMQMLGAPAHYADSGFSVVSQEDGRVTLAGNTLWRQSPNRLTASGTEPGIQRGADAPGVRFWYDGPRGTVRVAYTCPACLPRTPATGSVAAAPGTPLDAVLGGNERPGVGFFIRTDLVATAELLPRS